MDKNRSKPVLTQAWVNDASYFDGTGFAEITFADESARIQRFEQEVKLISHNGILLLLHKEVKTSHAHACIHSFFSSRSQVEPILLSIL